MPFDGNVGGPSKGPGIMAGGMSYPQPAPAAGGFGNGIYGQLLNNVAGQQDQNPLMQAMMRRKTMRPY